MRVHVVSICVVLCNLKKSIKDVKIGLEFSGSSAIIEFINYQFCFSRGVLFSIFFRIFS